MHKYYCPSIVIKNHYLWVPGSRLDTVFGSAWTSVGSMSVLTSSYSLRQSSTTTLSKPVCSLRKETPFKGTCGEFPFLSPILWGYSVRMNLASPQGRYMYHLLKQYHGMLTENSFAGFPYFLLDQEVYYLLNDKPPLLLSTVMEFTFQVRRKLLSFSLNKLSTSSFISNFSECIVYSSSWVSFIFRKKWHFSITKASKCVT